MKLRNHFLLTLTLVICLFSLGFASGQAVAAVDPLKTLCTGSTGDPAQPHLNINGGSASNTRVCQDRATRTGVRNPVISALALTINILSIIIGLTSVIVVILGGFSMITSNGDAQSVAKARSSIIYALVGVVIAVFARIIVVFVVNKL